MAMDLAVKGGRGYGRISVAFGTKIVRGLPGRAGCRTRLRKLVYTAAGTEHAVTVLRAIGKTRAVGAVASGQTDIVLQADPGPTGNGIGNDDRVAIKHAVDGVTRFYLVAAASGWNAGTKTLKLSAALAVAVSDRDQVYMFGVEADVDPNTGEAHPVFRGIASVTTTYADDVVGLVESNGTDEPLLVISNNITATGYLEQTSVAHTVA